MPKQKFCQQIYSLNGQLRKVGEKRKVNGKKPTSAYSKT